MTQDVIGVGTLANDNTGDYLRPAFIKVNANFTQLFEFINNELSTVAITGDYTDLNNKPSFGTAAYLNVGVLEGNVVQVGVDGKLPALDGSLLTNISGGGGGGGDVTISGTPTANQTTVWTDDNTVKGVTTLAGGTTGQVLTKINGTDFNYEWASGAATIDVSGTPTTNQLARWTDDNTLQGVSTITMSYISDAGTFATANIADYNFVPDGGATGEVLAKASAADGDTEWISILTDVESDTSPSLGGNLDIGAFTVGAATAADLTKLHDITADSTELNYVDGVTSSIQTQINAKVTYSTGSVAPASAPGAAALLYVDTNNENVYISTNTGNVDDWLQLVAGAQNVKTLLESLDDPDSIELVEELGGLTEDDVETITYATNSQINAGTAGNLFMIPSNFITSNYAYKELAISVFDSDESVATGDGVVGIPIPSSINGLNVKYVIATVHTKGVTGATDVQLRRRRGGSNADVLSTKVTIGDEWFAADGVIDTSNDDLATGDMLFVDVDAVHSGTAPLGLSVAIYVGV